MHKTCFSGAPLESVCHFICPILSVYGPILNRGSYMSGHVLLNLLNKLGKSDQMLSKAHILSLKFSQRVVINSIILGHKC